MATAVPMKTKAHTRRGSLSVVKPREERLDKTQGLHESDYQLQAGKDVELASAVPLDVFDYTQLEDVTHLASGAFSHVYAAKHLGRDVVVKLLREQYKDSSVTLKQMRFEQVLLSQLRHKNIVDFMGTVRRPGRGMIGGVCVGGGMGGRDGRGEGEGIVTVTRGEMEGREGSGRRTAAVRSGRTSWQAVVVEQQDEGGGWEG